MKIAILGSRGIPNRYGGFEQFAEFLSAGLTEMGIDVWVYTSHRHPYTEEEYRGAHLIRCRDPEGRIGAAGQFIYDLNCILDSRKRGFDVILQLGYTSSSIWHRLLPGGTRIVTNMDGLEWKRSKYPAPVRRFLRYAERLAVRSSHTLVADSEAIQKYLEETYKVSSVFIPYGAVPVGKPDEETLRTTGVEPYRYLLLIARMQPDNHVEEVIRGVISSGSEHPLLVVGNTDNSFGRYLKKKYASEKILFMDGIYDQTLLNSLRFFCKLYFHGHSAGGTNPSLLEAMAASAPIVAHNNDFNRSVLGDDALWFVNEDEVAHAVANGIAPEQQNRFIENNLKKIKTEYTWEKVIREYADLLLK